MRGVLYKQAVSAMILLAEDHALRTTTECFKPERAGPGKDIEHSLIWHEVADVIEQHHLRAIRDRSRRGAWIDQQLSSLQLARYDSHPQYPAIR